MSVTKKEKEEKHSKKPRTEYYGDSATGDNNRRTKKNPGAGQSGSGSLSYGS
jgi:hypothetical protein